VSDYERISKLLSLMLRHRPDEFGLNVDEYGYAPVEDVVEALGTKIEDISDDILMAMLNAPGQRRFELNEKGVRAKYGHSFFVEMDDPEEPPDQLYIGCTQAQAATYSAKGIRPADRSYIHLSISREAAEARNLRVELPCLAVIAAREAHEGGVEFYPRGEIVLCRDIPSQFISNIEHADPGSAVSGEDSGDQSTVSYGRRPRKATRRR
jgi:putative RNA 2'-phosphotransferase